MIKNILRKYINKYLLAEATALKHFGDRIDQVLNDIDHIRIPDEFYLPDISKEDQNLFIINTIKEDINKKINLVSEKNYPIGGSCVVVPLGGIVVRAHDGKKARVRIFAKKGNKTAYGVSYYIVIYDNRLVSFILANPAYPENSSPENQLEAHIRNTLNNGFYYDKDKSYADTSFNNPLIISMKKIKQHINY